MKLDTFLADLVNSIEGYEKETQSSKDINYSLEKESLKNIKEMPWLDYKYFIQQLCSKDYAFSNKETSLELLPLENVLLESFEICCDLCFSLFYQDKQRDKKQIECLKIIYKMALISNKMLKAEYSFSTYLEKNIMIRGQSEFIDAVCYNFLNMILTFLFKDEETKWVYTVINAGISRLKKINIQYGYPEKHPIIIARTSWIELLFIIKSEIEGALLNESKAKVLKRKWKLDYGTGAKVFSSNIPEIILPYPGTDSTNVTLEFIDYYLNIKAKESGNDWIKDLLKKQPKDIKDETLYGYYPFLKSFIKCARKFGIIKSTTTNADLKKYLHLTFSNKLSITSDFSDANQKNAPIALKYQIFNDMGKLFREYK